MWTGSRVPRTGELEKQKPAEPAAPQQRLVVWDSPIVVQLRVGADLIVASAGCLEAVDVPSTTVLP